MVAYASQLECSELGQICRSHSSDLGKKSVGSNYSIISPGRGVCMHGSIYTSYCRQDFATELKTDILT